MTDPGQVEHTLRELAAQVLAILARRLRDFAAAEDAVQEALIAAAEQWPREGTPSHPRAWLLRVAERRFTDNLRADIARRRRESAHAADLELVIPVPVADRGDLDPDDMLVLLFMCCHPALTPGTAIALTLRAVGGLTTAEIAKAFLVPEATIARRISRAKQAIKASGIPFELPDTADRAARLGSVLHVLYLIYNEGYTASSGPDLVRTDLSNEAIRLTRDLHRLLPEEVEIAGLLALMLLTDARRAARTGASGEMVPLDEQDRALWDRDAIAEGTALVQLQVSSGTPGQYQLQAAIAALHDNAETFEDTDWEQILALYGLLRLTVSNPMVELNHAVAVAMVRGPEAGLDLLAGLEADQQMQESHRLLAVRAHLLERAGNTRAAAEDFRAAAERTTSIPERDYLLSRAARLA